MIPIGGDEPRGASALGLVALTVALCFTRAPLARAVSDGEGQAILRGQLKDVLPAEARIRDSAPFETERGEGALLVLYVTDGVEPADDAALPRSPTCLDMVQGIPLEGLYHVALVVRGALVNTVDVPEGRLALPLRNNPQFNKRYWGQRDAPRPRLAETGIVRLADYTGDGRAWEFRLLRYEACGHVDTLLVGYSARRRRAIVYPVLDGGETSYWTDNFFPVRTHANIRRRLVVGGCDHGGETEYTRKYGYDARREAWVFFRGRERPCPQ